MTKAQPPENYKPLKTQDRGFSSHVGQLYIDERQMHAPRFAFLPEARHANSAGVVHGGMLMTLCDRILGLTVRKNVGTDATVTVSLTCQFLSAARPGSWIEGWAEIDHRAGNLIFIHGTLISEGVRVMSSNGIWKLVRDRALHGRSNA